MGGQERHPFASWLHQLSLVRNSAAHHARIWNARLIPASGQRLRLTLGLEGIPKQSDRMYGVLLLIGHLTSVLAPGSDWTARAGELLTQGFPRIPGVSLGDMGFPPDWAPGPEWRRD
jgi:abortive infection bacteriophage resistance protein